MNFLLPIISILSGIRTTLLVFSLLITVTHQARSQQRPPGDRISGSGKVAGTVIDAITEAPVEYATVALLSRRDSSLITGTVTDPQGRFTLEQVPLGSYRLRITYIGYRNAVRDTLTVGSGDQPVNLGNIRIRPSAQNLQEVVITAEKPLFEQSIDKRIFNVEKSIVTEGGSATDVLETIPSVSVDLEGNINLRGSGSVTILIDGKPSGLTGADRAAVLQQIPASTIESIEVITNPSARYDAEGMSGIINVILKKNKTTGFNGIASVSAGTRDKYNGSLDLNFRTPKFNAFTNYSYRYNTRFSRGSTFRQLSGSGSSDIREQSSDGLEVDRNHLIRGGIDYFAGEKTTLGISGVYRTSREKADEVTVNRTYSDVSDFYQLFNQVNDTREQGKNLDLNLDYKKTFATPGQALTGSVRYSFDSDDDTDLLTSQFTGIDNLLTDQPDNLRYNFEDVNNQVLTSQLDYVMPLPKERKVEAGYKSIVRNIDNDFLFQNYSYASGAFEDVPELSNRFVFREQVHSLYSSFSGTVKNFGYQAGLRAEQTLSRSDQRTTDQKFRNDYLNFFPSVFLSYQLKDEQQLQLNYSRRINRPGLRELNPFINYSDTLNLRQGNPRLNPELTDAMEVSYQRNLKGLYITTSLFYRVTNNVIQRIIEVNANNISTTTFQNIDNRNSMGVELIARGSLTPWWNITSSFNLFRSAISGRSIQANYTNKNVSWTLSLLSNMNIPKVMQVQVAANYSGPNVTPQGIRRAIYGINVGLRKDVLKDRGSVSLNVTDIFDTREFRLQTNVPNEFTQTSTNKRESRIATLTFTWRFGKLLDSERNNRQGRENGPDSSGSDEDSF